MASTTQEAHLPALGAHEREDVVDAASQDVVIEVLRALEEQLWMIRAQAPEAGHH